MFTTRLEQLRAWCDLNQAELSRLCGFRHTYISSVERDPLAEVGRSRLVVLAITLGTSLDWLLLGTGKPPTREQVRTAAQRAQRDPQTVKDEIAAALGLPTSSTPRKATRSRRQPLPKLRAKPLRRSLPTEARPS